MEKMLCHDTQKFNFYLRKCVHDTAWIIEPRPEDMYTLTEDENYCSSGNDLWVDDQEKGYYLLCIDALNAVKIRSKRSINDSQSTLEQNIFVPACNEIEYRLLWPDPISMEYLFRCVILKNQSVKVIPMHIFFSLKYKCVCQ
jgi:hypothetical protein